MGSPLTLNLRNIVWHGFVFPGEVSVIFVSVIFLVLCSVGVKLQRNGLLVRKRKLVSLSKFRVIEENHPVAIISQTDFELQATNSVLFYQKNLPLVGRLFCYIEAERFNMACLLLLPLLESSLRKLFVIENNCPERSLTAESETFYTTFTEILAKYLPDGNINKTILVLGENLVTLLFDILLLPDGPRIRDKLGHGEVLFSLTVHDEIINKEMEVIARHLLAILTIILQTKSHNGPPQISLNYENYQSLFHPSTFLLRSLVLNTSELEEFQSIVQNLPANQGDISTSSENEYSRIFNLLTNMKLATLYRPRQEYEIINILTKISQSISLIISRSWQNVSEKTELKHGKTLRSRQRTTFDKMIVTLPKLMKSLVLLLNILQENLSFLEITSSLEPDDFNLWKKKFKTCLKICENLSTNVSAQKNKWAEVDSLFIDLKEKIF